MKTFINLGLGVNSTAILSLIKQGKLQFENPIVVFADVGAEKPEVFKRKLLERRISMLYM